MLDSAVRPAWLIFPSEAQMIQLVDLVGFVILYFEWMIPVLILALLTVVWFQRVDFPRLESRDWLKVGPLPETHHYLESATFFLFGLAFYNTGFPVWALAIMMVSLAVATYPLVRRFEAKAKVKDQCWLSVVTFLALEGFLLFGYSFSQL